MDQPKGYMTDNPDEKWLLEKAIYGLKQSPREWFNTCHNYLGSIGMIQSKM